MKNDVKQYCSNMQAVILSDILLLHIFLNYATIQELLGHKSGKTTEIYTHVTHTAKNKIVSPLDNLDLKINKIDTIKSKEDEKYYYEKSTTFVVYNPKLVGVRDKIDVSTDIIGNYSKGNKI